MTNSFKNNLILCLAEIKKQLKAEGCKYEVFKIEDLEEKDLQGKIVTSNNKTFTDKAMLHRVLRTTNVTGYMVDVAFGGLHSYTICIFNYFKGDGIYRNNQQITESLQITFCNMSSSYNTYFNSKQRTNKYKIDRLMTNQLEHNANKIIPKLLCTNTTGKYVGATWYSVIKVEERLSPTKLKNTIKEYNNYHDYDNKLNKLNSDSYKNIVKFKVTSGFLDYFDNILGNDNDYTYEVSLGKFKEGYYPVSMVVSFSKDGEYCTHYINMDYNTNDGTISSLVSSKLPNVHDLINRNISLKELLNLYYNEVQGKSISVKGSMLRSILHRARKDHACSYYEDDFIFRTLESFKFNVSYVRNVATITGHITSRDIYKDTLKTDGLFITHDMRLDYTPLTSDIIHINDIATLKFVF